MLKSVLLGKTSIFVRCNEFAGIIKRQHIRISGCPSAKSDEPIIGQKAAQASQGDGSSTWTSSFSCHTEAT
jgi:hypothetical protein